MQIREIVVTKEVNLSSGQKINVSLTGILGPNDTLNDAERKLGDMLNFKISMPAPRMSVLPSREDWAVLRQVVKQKTGYSEDDAIQDYIMGKLNVNNLELVSAQEVRNLAYKLKTGGEC